MALFKISKGLKSALDKQAINEGYCWYTTDDSLFYIDSTDAEGKPQRKALNAAQLNPYMNVGTGQKPVYIKDGMPTECGGTLDVNITGSAPAATLAEQAKLAFSLGTSDGTKTSLGTDAIPVYFKNGVPVACDKEKVFSQLKYTANATSGTIEATVADQGRSITIPAADVDSAGLLTSSDQTIGGKKTFNNGIKGDLEGNATSATLADHTKASMVVLKLLLMPQI